MFPGLMVLVAILMIVGVVGSALPIVPGTPLILLGALLYAFATDFQPVDGWRLLVLARADGPRLCTRLPFGALGARKLGGSRWAMLGALLGGLVGVFFGLVGIILGPIVGAVGAELVYRKEIRAGLKSGLGAVVGMLLGVVAKLSVAVIMVGLFTFWAFRG